MLYAAIMHSTTHTRDRGHEGLQVRNMDSEVYRQMRVECASLRIPLAELIARMWRAYEGAERD